MTRRQHVPAAQPSVWTWPLVLAALTLFGLIAALLGDGVWDTASWIALAAPLVVAWLASRKRRT